MEYLKNNLEDIEKRIQRACDKAGVERDSITVIAVTKTFEMDIVNESLKYGITDVAENKAQEVERKYPLLETNVTKHMIGHLQRNKVKKVVGNVDLIQSVDSIRLLDEIEKQSKSLEIVSDVLLQINIGDEEQKSGIEKDKIEEICKHVEDLNNVRVVGLMAMAPFLEDIEKTRPYFKDMKKIFDYLSKLSYNNVDMKYLSMGMSADFEVAIEEGSNMIRVGSAIYGNRNYANK